MTRSSHGNRFWAGNALLAASLAMLFFMGPLSEWLGAWAMALWMACAGAGMYLVVADRRNDPGLPD